MNTDNWLMPSRNTSYKRLHAGIADILIGVVAGWPGRTFLAKPGLTERSEVLGLAKACTGRGSGGTGRGHPATEADFWLRDTL